MCELNFGAKLTALRSEKGVTQDEVANALDISNKTVSKWENGSSSPDLEMLVRIAEYFDVSTDYLLNVSRKESVNIAEAIDREFSGIGRCDAVLKIFELEDNIFASAFGRMGDLSEEREVIPEVFARGPRKIISNEYVYQMNVGSENLNMSCSLFRNKSNFAWLNDEESIRRMSDLFGFFADKLSFKICRALHSESFPVNFTAKYLASAVGSDEEHVAELLEYACRIDLCDKQMAHLNDGDMYVYTSHGHGRILMLLSVAYEHMCGKNCHSYFNGGSSKMIGEIKK